MSLENDCTTKKKSGGFVVSLLLLASPVWITPRHGRGGGCRPPRRQRRHRPHERRVVRALRRARAGREAFYSGPLVCRAGPAVKLVSIHGSVVPTEVVEKQAGTQCDSSGMGHYAGQYGNQRRFFAPSVFQMPYVYVGLYVCTFIFNNSRHLFLLPLWRQICISKGFISHIVYLLYQECR